MRMASGPERGRLIRQIVTSIRCAVCGNHYNGKDIRLLGRRDELWVMRVVCDTCTTQGLVFALVKEGKTEVWSELTDREEARFAGMPPVTMDEVLDLHRELEAFEGDMEEFLRS